MRLGGKGSNDDVQDRRGTSQVKQKFPSSFSGSITCAAAVFYVNSANSLPIIYCLYFLQVLRFSLHSYCGVLLLGRQPGRQVGLAALRYRCPGYFKEPMTAMRPESKRFMREASAMIGR